MSIVIHTYDTSYSVIEHHIWPDIMTKTQKR